MSKLHIAIFPRLDLQLLQEDEQSAHHEYRQILKQAHGTAEPDNALEKEGA